MKPTTDPWVGREAEAIEAGSSSSTPVLQQLPPN